MVVLVLLEEGADVNSLRDHYSTAPQIVTTETRGTAGLIRVFKFLLPKPNLKPCRDEMFPSPQGQFEAFVQLLLDRKIDINIEREGFGTALQAASRGGHTDIVKTLLDIGGIWILQGGATGLPYR